MGGRSQYILLGSVVQNALINVLHVKPSLVEWSDCFGNLQEVSSHGIGQFSSSFDGVWAFQGTFQWLQALWEGKNGKGFEKGSKDLIHIF